MCFKMSKQRTRGYRKLKPYKCEHGHPLVKALAAGMHMQEMTDSEMARLSGINRNTLKHWRSHRNPRIPDLEACWNVLGFTLKPVPLPSRKQQILNHHNYIGEQADGQ